MGLGHSGVDSNYQHALAWYRALRSKDITIPIWRLHRGIGMGGDMFVPNVVGEEVEAQRGDELRELWVEEFDKLIDEIQPFEGARELLEDVKGRGFKLVLASSGKSQHVERFLDLLDGKSLADECSLPHVGGLPKGSTSAIAPPSGGFHHG